MKKLLSIIALMVVICSCNDDKPPGGVGEPFVKKMQERKDSLIMVENLNKINK